MNNPHFSTQIENMKLMLKTFEQSCALAARKDDGEIDREEARALRTIRRATARYLRALDSIR